MNKQAKTNISSVSIWIRCIYMLLFALIIYVVVGLLALIVVFQFIITLIMSEPNNKLTLLADILTQYLFQCFRFEAFVSDAKPFPFDDLPEPEPTTRQVLNSEGNSSSIISSAPTKTPKGAAFGSESMSESAAADDGNSSGLDQ